MSLVRVALTTIVSLPLCETTGSICLTDSNCRFYGVSMSVTSIIIFFKIIIIIYILNIIIFWFMVIMSLLMIFVSSPLLQSQW